MVTKVHTILGVRQMKVSAEELKLVMEDIAKMKLTSYKVKLIGYLSEL